MAYQAGDGHALGVFKRITPITFGGSTYTMAMKFPLDGPVENPPLGIVIANEDVEDLGGGLKQLVCKRAFRTSSYTKYLGPGDSIEIEYQVLMGGNVAIAIEPQRIFSAFDDEATNGLNLDTKARPGLCLLKNGRRYNIVSVEAFAVAPGSVSFHGDEDQIGPGKPKHNISDLAIIPQSWAELIQFDDSGTGLLGNCLVEWTDSITPAAAPMTARVFDMDDPYIYPADAMFDDMSPEYHWDGVNRRFRFGTQPTFTTLGADGVRASIYHGTGLHAAAITPEGINSSVAVVCDAAAGGYDEAGDELVTLALPLLGNIGTEAVPVAVIIEAGSGSIEIRDDIAAPLSRLAAVRFEVGTGILDVVGRSITGGTVTVHAVSASYAGEFEIGVWWDGSDVSFYHRAVGAGSWTLLQEVAVPTTRGGAIAIGSWGTDGARVRNASLPMNLVHLQATGKAWAKHTHARVAPDPEEEGGPVPAARGYATYPLPNGATSITEVRNMTTDTVMTEYGTASEVRRDVWQLDSGNVRLFSESSGDRIRITCAAGDPPEGTGRPPRVGNQVNWATEETVDGVGTGEATSNVNENRANWLDRVIFMDPRDTCDWAAGEGGELRDDAFADDSDPPTPYLDTRQGSTSTTYEAITEPNYLAFWPDGLVLLEQSFVNAQALTLTASQSFCGKAQGKMYRKRAGTKAKHFNEAARAFDCLDQASVSASFGGGGIADVSGLDYGMEPYPTAWTCYTEPDDTPFHKWTATGMAYGTKKSDLHPYSDGILAAGGSWGHYIVDPFDSTLIYRDAGLRSLYYSSGTPGVGTGHENGTAETTENCPEGPVTGLTDVIGTHNEVAAGEHVFEIYRGGVVGASGVPYFASRENWRIEGGVQLSDPGVPADNYFGAFLKPGVYLPYFDVSNNLPSAEWLADFGFIPISFVIPDWMRSLPAGTQITSAKLGVKFSGFRQSDWSNSVRVERTGPSIYKITQEYSRDGAIIYRYEGPSTMTEPLFVNPTPPDPKKGGKVTFALIGVRVSSRLVELLDGSTVYMRDDKYVALGNGLAVEEIADGEWGIVDISGMLQKLVDLGIDSEFGFYILFPTTGLNAPTGDPQGLASYLKSLHPEYEVEWLAPPALPTEEAFYFGYQATVSGTYSWFSLLETETSAIVSYRLPGGVLANRELPIYQPPLIAEFE